MTGEVISMQEYLERKTAPPPKREEITERLAQIALDQLLLQSEKHRLERQLFGPEQCE